MSTKKQNLSALDTEKVPSGKGKKVAIVVSEWNNDITFALRDGAVQTLKKHGVAVKDIFVELVPGSVELTFAAKMVCENYEPDAVITLGCVVQGETPHFDYVCQSVTYGITELNLSYEVPFIFGVLTVNTQQQAIDRAGGKHGNKGVECAVAALKMMALVDKVDQG
ncbi:MAG: 6,7-dimethyl-8-ribityllumazine synthase [Bacteroidetes bacterium HGW-Bacteroidetes-21]|jgi:6,7-dimethyl-8-ribityllumazine synthase|nr:MAG: 6,7-dimethyl-8-ribityllumazine synthase [Bacteroidetes bacterium HGW-Bacteroidetes-21]